MPARVGDLRLSRIIAGIDAAMRAGPGVINLSLGGPVDDPLLREAVLDAVRHGSLVVAAQGEDRFGGSPQTFPADEAHVLTVVATDREGTVYVDTNGSESNDLSAPGVKVEVAVPIVGQSVGVQDGDGHELRGGARLRGRCLDLDGTADARPESALPAARPQREAARSRPTTRSAAMASSTSARPSRLRLRPGIPSSRTTTSDMVRAGGLFTAATPSLDEPAPEDRVHPWLAGPERGSARRVPRLDPAPRKPRRNGHAASRRRSRCESGARAPAACSRGSARQRRDLLAIEQGTGVQRLRVSNRSAPRHVRLPRDLDRLGAELELRARALDAFRAVDRSARYCSLEGAAAPVSIAAASIAAATPSSSSTRRTGVARKRRRSAATTSSTAITSSEKSVVAVPSA